MNGVMRMMMGAAAKKRSPVEYVDSVALDNQSFDSNQSLTLNAHSVGDAIVAMTARRNITPPPLLAGFTDIVSVGISPSGGRSLRVQWKIASSASETIEWNGSNGYMAAFRGVGSLGQYDSVGTPAVSFTIPLPNLTGLDDTGFSLVLAGGQISDSYTGADSPYSVLVSGNGNECAAVVQNNTETTLSSKNIYAPGTVALISYAVELLP